MTKHLILVAGNIGAGKTSLAEMLGLRLGWDVAYESVDDNPYLSDFYQDMQAWSFHLQVFFLGHRSQQQQMLAALDHSVIIDRSIYEDAHIFARALHELGNMTERDYSAYLRLYQLVVDKLPRPDLLIYIKTTVPTLRAHIRKRGRAIELGIDNSYLALLGRYYEEWMADFDMCPVLTVPGDNLDFVRYPEHLEIIAERVIDKLAGKEVVTFPTPEEMHAS
ncbi:MAG: deoxynucleoside kinase [Anaerolineae bacterium]|nr:deoxynucleoside kinase [Anaerolineae bacterium]